MFPDSLKSKPQFLAEMRAVWQSGTDEQARVRILSRGIPSPVWAGASTSAESSGFDAVLSADGDGGDAGANLRDGDRAASRSRGRGVGSFSLGSANTLKSIAARIEEKAPAGGTRGGEVSEPPMTSGQVQALRMARATSSGQ